MPPQPFWDPSWRFRCPCHIPAMDCSLNAVQIQYVKHVSLNDVEGSRMAFPLADITSAISLNLPSPLFRLTKQDISQQLRSIGMFLSKLPHPLPLRLPPSEKAEIKGV